MKSNVSFYLFILAAVLFAIGYSASVEHVSVTTLPESLMCEKDIFVDQYLCYQP